MSKYEKCRKVKRLETAYVSLLCARYDLTSSQNLWKTLETGNTHTDNHLRISRREKCPSARDKLVPLCRTETIESEAQYDFETAAEGLWRLPILTVCGQNVVAQSHVYTTSQTTLVLCFNNNPIVLSMFLRSVEVDCIPAIYASPR